VEETHRTAPASWLYSLLRPWIKAGAWFFFRRIEITGKENIPANGPVILVANHQNAMLDPVMLCLFLPRQLHWLTRSDVFVLRPVRSLLLRFNMLPVYRERDKERYPDWSQRNGTIFDICFRRLKRGAVISLFPEGTHRGKKQLHLPLKKGAARLAMGVLQAGVDPRLLTIIPVGLDYSDYYSPRGELLIRIGKAISLDGLNDSARANDAVVASLITDRIREGLLREMIDIRAGQDYDEYIGLRQLTDTLGMVDKFSFYQTIIRYLHDMASDADRAQVREHVQQTRKLRLDEHAVEFSQVKRGRSELVIVALIVTFPLIFPARLLLLPLHQLVEWFISTRVRDPLFYNSIRMAAWTFLYPLWGALVIFLTFAVTDTPWIPWIPWITVGLLTAGGWLSLWWMEAFVRLRRARRFRLLLKRGDTEIQRWWTERISLIKSIKTWYEKAS